MKSRTLVLSVLLGACVDASPPVEETSGPLVGVDGSVDSADRACHVVLRDLARVRDGGPGYLTDGSSWVWAGTVEVSAAAAAEGLTPRVLYQSGSDPTWWSVEASPSTLPATAGFARFDVRLAHALPGPGWSGTSLTNVRVAVVPFLAMPEGGRLFDHNRFPGELDNATLAWSGGFAIAPAPTVCPGALPPEAARVTFAADFTHTQAGTLLPGGAFDVVYDATRLAGCARLQGGRPAWDVTAHLRWLPGEQRASASVLAAPARFAVPADAQRVEAWFEATNVGGCQAWDSDFGANYRFAVTPPPSWVGGAVVRITRSTDDACDGGGDASQAFVFDTWARSRAAITNVCVRAWAPGLTEGDGAPPYAARLRYRGAGTTDAWHEVTASFDRRVGNDARFTINLRALDPFAMYRCPDVPTWRTDGPGGAMEHADVEYELVVGGVVVRGAPGAPWVGHFADYADNAYRAATCGS